MKRLKTSWDNHYLFPAYVDFLFWAITDDRVMRDFRAETGNTFEVAKTPLNKLIDSQLDVEFEFIQAFSDFCEKKHFGTPDDL